MSAQAGVHDPVADIGEPDLERFQIHSRVEIIALLRALIQRRATLTLHFNQGEEFIVSSLLGVNPDFEELVLDPSGDEATNRRLVKSRRISLVAFLDQVKIQFVAPHAELTNRDGRPAIRVRIPDSVLRLQRRDFYRITPPVARPLLCKVEDPLRLGAARELRVLDISGGGLALAASSAWMQADVGTPLEGCTILLPEIGVVTFTGELRSRRKAQGPGDVDLHCGIQFTRLPPQGLTLVQRYITRLERERIAKS